MLVYVDILEPIQGLRIYGVLSIVHVQSVCSAVVWFGLDHWCWFLL